MIRRVPVGRNQELQIIVDDAEIQKKKTQTIWAGVGLLMVGALVIELRRQQRKRRRY
jgi:hypothetical protein